MNKKALWIVSIVFFSAFVFLWGAQPSWAIQIDHVSGVIYAETGTTFNGPHVWSVGGWEASGGVKTEGAIFNGTSAYGYGQASGYKINGPLNNGNHARFILHSTAQSAAGSAGQAYETYAFVTSGENPGDMLEFVLTPETGEAGMGVELSAEAVLSGTLNSGGLTGYMPWLSSGTALIDFSFEIYKDPTAAPVISFSYSDSITSDGIDNGTGWPTLEESLGLPDSLGLMVDNTSFKTGDHFYVYFNQEARAIVPEDSQSSAKAYAVQSTTDVITIGISAKPVPEPSTLLLLGIAFIGLLGVIIFNNNPCKGN